MNTNSADEWVLALDGGGTKTQVALASLDGAVLFAPQRAGINPMDNPRWRDELERCLSASSFDERNVAHATLGLPGYGEIGEITTLQEQAARELCPFPATIVNDVELAHDGAFLDQPGILVLSGTGSMALGRDANNRQIRVGGLGEAIGDEGSAYWIGREAIARVSWILDGRLEATSDSSAFAETILNAIGDKRYKDPLTLMDWYYQLEHPRSEVAALTRLIDQLARDNNAAAKQILYMAAQHLSRHIDAVRYRLDTSERLAWSFAGSVFNSEILKARIVDLQKSEPILPKLSPTGGGLWVAARHANWPIDIDWANKINNAIGQ